MIFSILPAISVYPSASLEKSDPFSAPFIIVNNGSFSVYDVEISFEIKKLKTSKKINVGDATLINTSVEVGGASEIKANHSLTKFLALNRVFKEMDIIQRSDVELIIKYRPSFFPWKISKIFNFYSHQDSDGSVTWLPY